MRIAFGILAAALAACGESGAPETGQAAQGADRIFVGGDIWTGADAQLRAEAFAVAGDRILAVGSSEEIRGMAGPDATIVDLGGRLVVPGFQDSHLHPFAVSVDRVDLEDVGGVEEMQAILAEFAEANPDLPWIQGRGWAYAAFPDQQAHKRYIDEVIADRPVYLVNRDGHMGLGNSRALELAGVTRDTPDPDNGRIVRDENGDATGELQESAQSLVRRLIPPDTPEQIYRSLVANMEHAAANGLTAFHQAGASLGDGATPDVIAHLERALAEGTLKQRFQVAMRMRRIENEDADMIAAVREEIAQIDALRARLTGPYIEARSIKGMLDGTIDATTAAMFEPYVGAGDWTGLPFWEQEDLNTAVALYDAAGYQVMLHAIGDRAINMAVNAFEHASRVNDTTGRRHRIEHAEMPRLDDLPRMRALGVIASTQAMFANPDATVLENFQVLLGPERAQYADNFAIWDEAGVVQVFGSDFPVMTLDVLRGIEVAATRMTEEGTPPGGWFPEGRISVEAALRHYTVDAAYAVFEEDERGTIEPGKFADFVVLSRNIFEIPPTEISETEILLTVMGGRDTYRSEAF